MFAFRSVGLLSLVACLGLPGLAAAAEPPNFLLILVDDLGWSDVGCYGSDLHETPHIDRLATQGVRFTNGYAAAAVCTPTRAAIMTGKSPARLHMTIWHEASQQPPKNRKLLPPVTVGDLPHGEVTIAERLQAAGYATTHIGKWHLGGSAHAPETHGFDINIGGTHWGAPATFFYPYRGLWSRSDEFRYVPDLEWGEEGEYLTDRLTDEAIRVIRRQKDRPFFLQLAYHTVHTPIEAKAEVVERYRAKLVPGLHHQNPTYAAMVHSLDENVGRLMALLDELNLADDTVVVFTSDNGGYINEYRGTLVTNNHPLRSGKGSLYEGGIRIPWLMRCPGMTAPGGICDEPIISMDLYPTMMQLAGLATDLESEVQIDGTSIVPLLKSPRTTLDRDALYFHYPHYYPTTTPVGAVRVRDWKLIEYYEDRRVELYDLKSDPGESTDLSRAEPARAERLRQRLHSWRAAVDAQMPE